MKIRNCVAFALIAGVIGALIGRTVLREAPGVHVAPIASPARSAAAPARRSCNADRADLVGLKVQLAFCIASRTRDPAAETSGIVEAAPPNSPESEVVDARLPSAEDRQTYQQFVNSDSGTVLVRHSDGTLGVYHPEEWPIDGDGVILARKLPNDRLGWYAGPEAGPRSDPAAFRPWEPQIKPLPIMRRDPDGTITLDGKPASSGVQFMFGGKVDKAAKPQP